MSAASLTFRCYQCQKLLKVSRARAGSVVRCPKCGAELVVPQVEAENPAAMNPAPDPQVDEGGFPAGLFTTEAAGSVSGDAPAFFPEIRTGPASSRPETPPASPPESPPAAHESPFAFLQTGPSGAPAATPFPFVNTGTPDAAPPTPPAQERPKPQKRIRPRPEPPAQAPAAPSSGSGIFPPGASFPVPPGADESAAPTIEYNPPAPAPRAPGPEIAPTVTAWPTASPESSILPPIATQAEPLRVTAIVRPRIGDREDLPRRNDVAMPRTVVVLWSFFVLLALVAAFAAGLLAGHFLWK
jgi:hypothetical protein